MSLDTDDIEVLTESFVQWAQGFLHCSKEQAHNLVQQTRSIFDRGCHAVPSLLAQHSVPLAYCLAYQRLNRRAGVPVALANPTNRELCDIALSLGVMLPSLKTDNPVQNQLPTVASFGHGLRSLSPEQLIEMVGNCTVQIDRCVELLPCSAQVDVLAVSEDIVSVLSLVLRALRQSSGSTNP